MLFLEEWDEWRQDYVLEFVKFGDDGETREYLDAYGRSISVGNQYPRLVELSKNQVRKLRRLQGDNQVPYELKWSGSRLRIFTY